MKHFFSVIFMNFWGFDLVIFIAALINCIFYRKLAACASALYDKMHLTVYVPDGSSSKEEAENDMTVLRETDIVSLRNKTGNLYSIFINITGIFPLLGILGTVISLLGLVDESADIVGNFYGALTSTFWGLVFAIIFKFLDGIVSAKIEDNEKTVALYLDRNYSSKLSAEMQPGISEAHIHISAVQPEARAQRPDVPDDLDADTFIIPSDDDNVDDLIKAITLGEE